MKFRIGFVPFNKTSTEINPAGMHFRFNDCFIKLPAKIPDFLAYAVYNNGELYLSWGEGDEDFKVFYMPWLKTFYKRFYYGVNGLTKDKSEALRVWFDVRFHHADGDIQLRKLTAFKEVLYFRPYLFEWLKIPIFTTKRYDINIEFDEETGKDVGTWEGGTIMTSYIIEKHTPLPFAVFEYMKENNLELVR